MSLRFWNKFASLASFELENELLGTEFIIEDGRVTGVINKQEEEVVIEYGKA